MTTAPAVDERLHAAAVAATVQASLISLVPSLNANVFDFGSVPGEDQNAGTVPDTYIAIAVERRPVISSRLVQQASRSGWRVSARYVARTVNNARLAALAVTTALGEQRLSIDGHTSTPVQLESTTLIQPDAGWFSGLSVWTYAI